MTWLFGSRHDENVTHGRILDAVEACKHDVNECAKNIAVIHETLTSGGDRFKRLEDAATANSKRIEALELQQRSTSVVADLAKTWILPLMGGAAFLWSAAMWLGGRLDNDTIAPRHGAAVERRAE